MREMRPKVLFLTSPNNPDGSTIAESELLELLELPVSITRHHCLCSHADHCLALVPGLRLQTLT